MNADQCGSTGQFLPRLPGPIAEIAPDAIMDLENRRAVTTPVGTIKRTLKT
jgi:hypothetical protein